MKLFRYIKAFKDVALKKEVMSTPPIHMQLEPTSICNLSCLSCSYKEKVKNPHNLSFSQFKGIYDPIKPFKLTLSGVGETFLNPEIFEMIRYAKDNGSNVNTSSNGTTVDKIVEKIVESGLDLLKISIDSDNRETYEKVRNADLFDRVISGVEDIARLKKERSQKTPYLRFQFVIQNSNYKEIAGVVRLAHNKGVDAVNFQILELGGVEERREDLIGGMTLDSLRNSLNEGRVVAEELGVRSNLKQTIRKLPEYWEKYTKRRGCPRLCILPWFSTYVDIDGNMRPCCSFGLTFTEVNMGNILTDGIEGSWNSERYRQFRKSIKDGTVPFLICKTCIPQTPRDIIEMAKILPGFLGRGD
ncbi:MAG: radical SAM protein [Proteobacteria bacterium]|nr:radical SAM protein [Pseudomonadota bacterium]